MGINLAIFGHGMSLKKETIWQRGDFNLRRWYQSTGCRIYFSMIFRDKILLY